MSQLESKVERLLALLEPRPRKAVETHQDRVNRHLQQIEAEEVKRKIRKQ